MSHKKDARLKCVNITINSSSVTTGRSDLFLGNYQNHGELICFAQGNNMEHPVFPFTSGVRLGNQFKLLKVFLDLLFLGSKFQSMKIAQTVSFDRHQVLAIMAWLVC